MAIVELKLLGPFEARDERGRPVHLPSRKVRALLAFLTLHPDKRFTRGYLATLLWGDDQPDNARHSLRQALTALRRECRGLEVNTQFVRLPAGVIETDVDLIERAAASQDVGLLERAAALGDGELLEGYEHGTEMFGSWLYPERERLRAASRAVLESLIRALPEHGQHKRALFLARQLINYDPFEEGAHRLYLSMLVATGQQRAAMKHYHDLREFLHRELGTEPEPATTAIVTRAIAADAPASVLDVLRQHLTGYAPGGETSRWEILLVGPSGSLFDAAGRTAIPAGAPISRAVKQALSGGLGNGPVMLAPTREHLMCVLIPLRNPAGALDGALALMAPADDAARRATRPASRRATPTMKMTTQAGRS